MIQKKGKAIQNISSQNIGDPEQKRQAIQNISCQNIGDPEQTRKAIQNISCQNIRIQKKHIAIENIGMLSEYQGTRKSAKLSEI